MHILGASGHAKVIVDILNLKNEEVVDVWDDNEDLHTFLGFQVRGNIRKFSEIVGGKALIAIGDNRIRKIIADQLSSEFGYAIHPGSVVARSAELSAGTVIMANVTVNPDVFVGKHVILNTNASIDHDCKIGDFVHISPNVGMAGNVLVGEGAHIGIGASIIQGIKIGKWSTIGAGSVIIRDVPDYAVVVGNPGAIIKYNLKY